MSKTTWQQVEIFGSVSLCPPPCRMVVLQTGDEAWRTCYPVLAIRSKVSSGWNKKVPTDSLMSPPPSPEVKDLIASGFRFEGQGVQDDLLLLADPDGSQHVYPLREAIEDSLPFRVVMCHWPPGEDSERFEPIYKELAEEQATKKKGAPPCPP